MENSGSENERQKQENLQLVSEFRSLIFTDEKGKEWKPAPEHIGRNLIATDTDTNEALWVHYIPDTPAARNAYPEGIHGLKLPVYKINIEKWRKFNAYNQGSDCSLNS